MYEAFEHHHRGVNPSQIASRNGLESSNLHLRFQTAPVPNRNNGHVLRSCVSLSEDEDVTSEFRKTAGCADNLWNRQVEFLTIKGNSLTLPQMRAIAMQWDIPV